MLGFPMAIDAPPIAVIDGDTFRLGPETIRIENIDTPEMGRGAKCDAEANLATLAKARLSALLKGSEGLKITRLKLDRYGRTLALVSVRGGDVGVALISEHLAVPWGGRRHSWCGKPDRK